MEEQPMVQGDPFDLRELESAMSRVEGVRQCRAVFRVGSSEERHLIGYYVADGNLHPEELRARLEEALPEYMIPAVLIALETFPLLADGEVDCAALPFPAPTAWQKKFVAPLTQTERIVASVWSELLHVTPVGRTDNFFELGGHSLLVMRALEQTRLRAEVDVPTVAMFEFPELRQFCAYLDQIKRSTKRSD